MSVTLVVGAGLSGATVARVLADRGEKVLVIDRERRIGGACYDERDESGSFIHRFGPHVFHTDDAEVWVFLSRFTEWTPYIHRVLGVIDGRQVPIPFNLDSIRAVFPASLADKVERGLIRKFGFGSRVSILDLRMKGGEDFDLLADYVWRKVFLSYTAKQWGTAPANVSGDVLARVPVLVSRDSRYFQDRWQGVPTDGYTEMIGRMLDSENISVQLGTCIDEALRNVNPGRIFHTGSVDDLMGFRFGELPYRSVDFTFRTFRGDRMQEAPVLNYNENHDFTRSCEYNWFSPGRRSLTTVSYERPCSHVRSANAPLYPVRNERSVSLYWRYVSAARERFGDVTFVGRLGGFEYCNMDVAVRRALDAASDAPEE